MTVAAYTLGCKVNQYDTEVILKDFSGLGFNICDFKDKADVYIINTCTVTNISDKKSRRMINRAYRQNPGAFIVAYGCYAKTDPETLRKLKGVSLVLGPQDKHRVAEIAAKKFLANDGVQSGRVPMTHDGLKRTRAYLKIQDGCDRFCSYCIVPYARGGVVSRLPEDVLEEAEKLVRSGTKEIVVAGIQIASYGKDLLKLINKIHNVPGLERLRLSSLEPNLIDENFLASVKNLPKLCDHFHLSLQSGSDRTLARMNRRYTTFQYAEAAERLRGLFPRAAFTTDIIVGFPGETEADFKETMDFVERIGFLRIHVFAYSAKAKTPAADFPEQIDVKTKENRSTALRQLAAGMNRAVSRQYIGETMPVLFESEQDAGVWEGHTTQYLKVRVCCKENLSNKILPVKLYELRGDAVYGGLI